MKCIYYSKHGCVEKLAFKIFEKIIGEKNIFSVLEAGEEIFRDDTIIILSPVYYGEIAGEIKKYINVNFRKLVNKRIVLALIGSDEKLIGRDEFIKCIDSEQRRNLKDTILKSVEMEIVDLAHIFAIRGVCVPKNLSKYEKMCIGNVEQLEEEEIYWERMNAFWEAKETINELEKICLGETKMYYEEFKEKMLECFNKENTRQFCFLFTVIDSQERIVVDVAEGDCSIYNYDATSEKSFDLEIEATKEILNKVVDEDDDLTGVDAYFNGDLELEGDRAYLEDMFESFGIV